MIETIKAKNSQQRIALIIPMQFGNDGTQFATADTDGLQVGKIGRQAGEAIPAHRHLPIDIVYSGPKQEFIYVVSGKVCVSFFDETDVLLDKKTLQAGDAMLQISGGHQFEFLEKTQLIEVKQGPYVNQKADKTFI